MSTSMSWVGLLRLASFELRAARVSEAELLEPKECSYHERAVDSNLRYRE